MVKGMRKMTCAFAWKTGIGWEGWNEEWGNGMLEYWNVGELGGLVIIPIFHCSIIPAFLNCGNFSDKKETTQWAK
jgi:hypothetical protein